MILNQVKKQWLTLRRRLLGGEERLNDLDLNFREEERGALSIKKKCPNFDDFFSDVSSVFNLDVIEGARVTLAKTLNESETLHFAHTMSIGSYADPASQEAILRALLTPNGPKPPRGSASAVSLLRWNSLKGEHSALARFFSQKKVSEIRAGFSLPFNNVLRFCLMTPQLSKYVENLVPPPPSGSSFLERFKKMDRPEDMAMISIENQTENNALSAKICYQDGFILTGGFAKRLPFLRNLYFGGDSTILLSNHALMNNYGLRYERRTEQEGNNDDEGLTVVASMQTTPDFTKTMSEGLNTRLYSYKLAAAKKLNERIAISAEGEFFANGKSWLGKVGYEIHFPQARLQGCIDTNQKVQVVMEDISGLQLSADVDLKNDDYRAGFGFQLSSLKN